MPDAKSLIEKIWTLPPDRLAEVGDFVDFIREREQVCAVTLAATAASAPAFAAVWSNTEDDVYDVI